MEDLRLRQRKTEDDVGTLKSDVAVLKVEIANLRTQVDNLRTQHAKLPQSAMAIISLVLTALMFLLNLRLAGVI